MGSVVHTEVLLRVCAFLVKNCDVIHIDLKGVDKTTFAMDLYSKHKEMYENVNFQRVT